eukprot:SAG31_NODE_4843_length_2910_cov_2.040911_4_plen_152_part_00
MTTVGYGDIHPETEVEVWFAVLAMIMGGAVFGLIVGFLSDMSRRSNINDTAKQETIARLNAVVVPRVVPEVVTRCRIFMSHELERNTAFDLLDIMMSLPSELRYEVAAGMHWLDTIDAGAFSPGILHKVPFFHGEFHRSLRSPSDTACLAQ